MAPPDFYRPVERGLEIASPTSCGAEAAQRSANLMVR
jgi:hypothetical protein